MPVASPRVALPCLAAALLLLAGLWPPTALAAEPAVGDRVTVDVNMSTDPQFQSWQAGTLTAVQTWQGRVSGLTVRLDSGREVTTAARFMRPAGPPPATATPPADPPPATGQPPTSLPGPASLPGSGGFVAGDRVEVDANMTSDPSFQTWRGATIIAIQEWQGQVSGITVRTDDGREITTAARFLRRGAAPAPVAGPVAVPAPTPPVATPAPTATGDAGSGACRVGLRVVDRDGRSGVVTRATGASCQVRLDATGAETTYLHWMLTPEGVAPEATAELGAGLDPGSYSCWAANGVAGTMRLVIQDGSRYTDGKGTAGTYAYSPTTGAVEWTSGPWAGFFGTKLGPGKIGISSRPGGFSNTVCDRR